MHEVIETPTTELLTERAPDLETLTYAGGVEEIVIAQGETLLVGVPGATEVLETPVTEALERTVALLELLDSPGTQELLEIAVQGPPGPAGGGAAAAPVSRSFTWSAGRLAGVAFADGRSKAFTWAGDQLTRVDTLRPGLSTLRADLTYNPDGTLDAVTQSEV